MISLTAFASNEEQSPRIGAYFLDSISQTLIRYCSTPEFTASSLARTDVGRAAFPLRSTTESRPTSSASALSLIGVAVPGGFVVAYDAQAPNT
jgi:hypothetical protein